MVLFDDRRSGLGTLRRSEDVLNNFRRDVLLLNHPPPRRRTSAASEGCARQPSGPRGRRLDFEEGRREFWTRGGPREALPKRRTSCYRPADVSTTVAGGTGGACCDQSAAQSGRHADPRHRRRIELNSEQPHRTYPSGCFSRLRWGYRRDMCKPSRIFGSKSGDDFRHRNSTQLA